MFAVQKLVLFIAVARNIGILLHKGTGKNHCVEQSLGLVCVRHKVKFFFGNELIKGVSHRNVVFVAVNIKTVLRSEIFPTRHSCVAVFVNE